MSKFAHINPATFYQTVLPSTKKQIQFRAYNVKEEKQLLLAEQSEDGITMIKTLSDVVASCLIPEQDNLTTFDVEYLFQQIRQKQVGEISRLNVGCSNVGCEDVQIEYMYPLQEIKIQYPENSSDFIKIQETLGFKMKYPSIDDAIELEQIKDETQKKFKAVSSSIVQVYHQDEVINIDSADDLGDVMNLIDSLHPQDFAKLSKFFDDIPYIYGQIKYKCTKCRTEHALTIRGLSDFFA